MYGPSIVRGASRELLHVLYKHRRVSKFSCTEGHPAFQEDDSLT